MERFYSQRESILVAGYNNNTSDSSQIQRPFTNQSTPNRNSDVDFNDVFGGPPRRSSVNEMRHSFSFSRLQDLEEKEEEKGEAPLEHEKPVFGEDNGIGIRRRYPNKNNDFFDDIFGGEESSPRMRDGVLSPARPLPSAVEHIGSLPSSFSLPAKMTKGVDLPTVGSPNWISTLNNIIDGTSNRLASSSDSHLSSRFSPQTLVQRREEFKNDSKPSYRHSLLSQEFSNGTLSDKADHKGSNMKQDPSVTVSEVFTSTTSNGHFHFSIYKWASKEVPLGMPLRTQRSSRTKDKVNLMRCSSAQELMINDEITIQNGDPIIHYNNASSLMKTGKPDHGSSTNSTPTISGAESSTYSLSEIGFSEKTEAPSETHEVYKSKPLRSLFNESDEKQDFEYEITKEERGEESKAKNIKKSFALFDVPVNPKKREEKTVSLRKVSSQGSLGLGENVEKSRVKGKVKEFVRIFNEEAVTKPRVYSRSQGSTYKQRGALRTTNEVEGYPELSKKEISTTGTTETTDTSSNNLSHQDHTSAPGDRDESFNSNYTIQVLAEDEKEDLQSQNNQEIQVIDSKIQQWSKGKEGNIRSLLSTLQYVLWPECGWKSVPLVDIIEGNAVKRAYQRALLCLHPDKLQQKGAASHQKYIAEKVFDVLQEGWTQFNMLGAL